MTATPTLDGAELDDRVAAAVAALVNEQGDRATASGPAPAPETVGPTAPPVSLRPVLAAGLSCTAAALVIGGIFGSWGARLFSTAAVAGGAALAALALRSKRGQLLQLVAPLLLAGVAVLSVLPESPGEVVSLVRSAVDAGRLLQPPVPFDPGWRPLLVFVLGLLAFGSAWVASAGERPVLGVVVPLPLVGLAAITQPPSEQVLAGVFAFLPVLAAMGVLFGADDGASMAGESPGRQFELRRALRGGGVMVGLSVALVAAGQLEFLFPKPSVDPNDRPQQPKSVPLSAANDRVLFSVQAPPGFTGPWRTGVLDVLDDGVWKLAGGSSRPLRDIGADGSIGTPATTPSSVEVTLTTGDLGPTPVLPVVPTSTRIAFTAGASGFAEDDRAGVVRLRSGRVTRGTRYTLALPPYPTAAQLLEVPNVTPDPELTAVPPPPAAVKGLLASAPPGPWARLDHLRRQLLDNVTSAGAGRPVEVDAAKVQDMLAGSKRATPYEIVAAQALLARWTGIPSRIGFGFNGVNAEGDVQTVRPKNAAQWLEVRIDGYGWLPLLDVPAKAQADLDAEDDSDDRVTPSDDIAVEVFVPIETRNPRLLFEQVRAVAYVVLPILAALTVVWVSVPFGAKVVRRRRRERWADAAGPRARIAAAYAELRDVATDLSVGDPFATPLEYLSRVVDDPEHTELAWLVSRAMYGDLATEVTDADADAAELMAVSLARRLRQAQPLQVRAVAALSKGSILRPFTDEVPGITLPTPVLDARAVVAARWHRVRVRLDRRRAAAVRVTTTRRLPWRRSTPATVTP